MFRQLFNSSFIRHIGIYSLSNIINAAVPFLLLPVLTRYLTTADYGITATFQVLIGFFIPILGLNTQGWLMRRFYDKDKNNFAEYVTCSLFILLISAGILLVILLPLAGYISKLTTFPKAWLSAVFITSFFQFVFTIILGIFQVRQQVFKYAFFQNGQTLLNILLSLILIILLHQNWQGRVIAQVIAISIFGILTICWLFNMGLIKSKVRKEHIKDALKFGVPLIPYTLTGWVLLSLDRIFINSIVGYDATGLYSVAFQFCLIISLIQVSFNNAWIPWFYKNIEINELVRKRKIVMFSYYFIALNFAFALLLTFAAPVIMDIILGKNFSSASRFIFWLSLAQACNAIHIIGVGYIFYHNKNIFLTYSAIATTIIHVPLTWFLIKNHGAMGAAQSLFLSNLITSLCTFFVAVRIHKMPWLLKSVNR